jgi:hypothetical protein
MKTYNIKAIAATSVAAFAVSMLLSGCEGRKMSNMTPDGETVEVVVEPDSTTPQLTINDSLESIS